MPVFISFLRGVNMTGHNKMKMADLSTLYSEMGFKNVRTFIQSGNVVFTTGGDYTVPSLSKMIESSVNKGFGYDVPVFIRTIKDLESLTALNPYLKEEYFDPSKMAVLFLKENASAEQMDRVINIDYPPDKFKVSGSEIFIYCPNGFGKTKLNTNFFEKKMGVTGTARNWNTILAIMEMATAICEL